MKKFFIQELIKPTFRRVGTSLGAFLSGATAIADAAQIEAAVVLLLGVGFDLMLSHLDRSAR